MNKIVKIIIGVVAVIALAIGAVFYFTAGMEETADSFFKAIKNQDIAAARGYLSEDFKASTDEAALKEFLSKGALLNFKKASWSNRQISGGRGELDGEVITESGGAVPLKLLFVKESDKWKIYSIQKPTAGLQTVQASPTVPAKAGQIAIVKRSMHDFAISVKNKSMAHFRSTTSQLWQKQFTIEKFEEAFGKVYNFGADFTTLDSVEPIIEPVSALGEHGELILKGYYPTKPNQVYFEQKFIHEGVDWKLYGFKFDIR
jgi:hypothetical protein